MSVWPLLLFTIVPGTVLAFTSGVSIWRVRKTGEYRLLLLASVLAIMLSHQMLEARTFVLTGTAAADFGEWIETTANVTAAVAVYYATGIFEQERELRTDLATSERRYRTLIDESPLPILVHELGEVTYANDSMAGLLAAESPDALTGDRLSEILDSGSDRDVAGAIQALTGDRTDASFAELVLVDFDGTERTVLVSGARTGGSDGYRTHLVFRDVTREREVQRELERMQGRLETTLESSNDAIFLIDPDEDEIVDANSRAAEMLRYDREDLVGLSPFEIHPHEVSTFDEFLERVSRDGSLLTDELSCLRKDGVEIPAEISASVTTVEGRECVLAAVRDVSERRRRQRQVEVLERVLRHNLRNDMTVVLGQAEVIESRTDDDTIGESARRIQETAGKLIGLSEKVRNLQSTIRSRSFESTDVDLGTVVEGVVDEFREGYPHADVTVDVPNEATVHEADPEPLAWALSNLVENAIVHNDRSRPSVRIVAEKASQHRGDWIAVRVYDGCPKIPIEERRATTDPTRATDLSHGTGLGLWVVGHVADAFDGEVVFDSRDNDRGNVVTLCLRGTVERSPRTEV